MRSELSWPVFAIALSTAGSAVADDNLKGSYAYQGTQACLWAPSGFANDSKGSPMTPNDNNSFLSLNNYQGLIVFNGDGTGKITGTYIGLTPPPPDSRSSPKGGIGSGTYSYAITYTPLSNNSFNWSMKPGTYQGTVTHGGTVGQQFSIDRREGAFLISSDQKQIMSTNEGGFYVENDTISGSPPSTTARSCFYSNNGFRLE